MDGLKAHLLAGTMASDTRFDPVILDIGRAVAGLFDAATNRELAYQVDAEILFTGDRSHYVLPRYPVASIKSVQMRFYDSQPWQDITGQPLRTNPSSGLVHFGGVLGTEALQVRMVWTGGYWFNTSDGEDGPEVKPEGATELPMDLRGAFQIQCRTVWQSLDKLGTDILKTGSSSQFVSGSISSLDLAPMVKQVLNEYVRYQLS